MHRRERIKERPKSEENPGGNARKMRFGAGGQKSKKEGQK
jgi:hypothetical protein